MSRLRRLFARRRQRQVGEDASGATENHFAVKDIGRTRKTNQDEAISLELADGAVLLVVADGVGGSAGGEVASAATVAAVQAVFRDGNGDDPGAALRRGIETANACVLAMAAADAERPQMASTVVVAVVAGNEAWVANVGDSRGYALQAGTLRQLTTDDSWVSEQVRDGLMSEGEAERSPYKNVITRGVGVEERVDVGELARVSMEVGDVVLLCSDGLYRMVAEAEIGRVLGLEQALETTARQLVRMANDAGGADNISLAVYRHPAQR